MLTVRYFQEYCCIENNPMRGVFNPNAEGSIAVDNGCYSTGLLYFDEALKRQYPVPIWFKLSIVLHKMNRVLSIFILSISYGYYSILNILGRRSYFSCENGFTIHTG